MARLSDTSPEADRVLTEVYRRLTPAEKWRQLGQMFRDARALHAMGLRMTNPAITSREITADWIRRNLGIDLPVPVREPLEADLMPTLHEFADVARIFDRLGLRYALSGSMASSVYGISRSTNDADVLMAPFAGKEQELIEALGDDFYASDTAIRDAIARRSSFNLINTRTGFKVDVFILTDEPFERSAWARVVPVEVEGGTGEKVTILSVEDVLLSKLRWYRLGDESSPNQWNDVIGIVKTKRSVLDLTYLEHWAANLGVDDLLARALAEVPAE
jgi:hypothetical protein